MIYFAILLLAEVVLGNPVPGSGENDVGEIPGAPPSVTYECHDVGSSRVEFDRRCERNPDLLGCNAGNQGLHCRFCGFGLYPACPGPNEAEPNPLDGKEILDYLEGDILVIGQSAKEYLHKFSIANKDLGFLLDNQLDEGSRIFQNAIVDRRQLWRNAEVPFTLSNKFDDEERKEIYEAMATLERYTCIKFVPRVQHDDYVIIYRGGGCFSYVGRFGGPQPVSLGLGCVFTGAIMHELIHALGFHHEQSRADRDDWVEIRLENVISGMEGNFEKYTLRQIDHLNEPYDYESLMHYTEYAFSKDGVSKTVIPKQPGVKLVHAIQKELPSQVDVNKINKLYSCPKSVVPDITTPKPLPQIVDPDCQDINPNCRAWNKAGHCGGNPDYMKLACPWSCNYCDDAKSRDQKLCQDHNPLCEEWRRTQKCSQSTEYMRVACPRACGYCAATCAGLHYDPEVTDLTAVGPRPQRALHAPPEQPEVPLSLRPQNGPQ